MRKVKQALAAVLTLVMVLAMVPASLAANAVQPGLSNFTKVNTYTAETFTDVPAGEWYAADVQTAYELGLVNGSYGLYSPKSNIQISAALVLACRMHSIYYTGKADFVQGAPWYQVYVDYAVANGIITAGQFSDYNAFITRRDFAGVMAKALPASALTAINTIENGAIPDVAAGSANYDAIYTLYRAGVLTGNDAYGTFTPDACIARSGVAALVARMANPQLRKSVSLQAATVTVSTIDGTPAAVPLNVMTQYGQIINDAEIYDVYGSGLCYANYVDVEGDGKVELLTLAIGGGRVTTTVYANVDGHVEKYCEGFVDLYDNHGFSTCRAGGQLYLRHRDFSGNLGEAYYFYKIDKGALALSETVDFLYRGNPDDPDNGTTALKKYTEGQEVLRISNMEVSILDRGLLPDPSAVMQNIYAAVRNGDFSAFAGTYRSRYGDGDATFDANGVLTTVHGETPPISITITEEGVIHCLGPYEDTWTIDGITEHCQEYYEIWPVGVGSYRNNVIRILYSRYGDGPVEFYRVS